jgi:hypothetical protein
MLREVSMAPPAAPVAAQRAPGRHAAAEPGRDRAATPPVSAVSTAAAAAPESVAAIRPVGQSIQLAASALFRDREVEVQGFRDAGSGRFVYRIADRRSGEVLIQSPPDALLRFFASARDALGPLVRIEA